MTARRKITLAVALILWLPILGFLGYAFIYQPLKFRYLISRIESANSAAEERDAFALAPRAGRVWEINRLRPQELPERARRITGDCVLELEWLESSAWTGTPYRAYRHVIDTNNMKSLYVRYNE